MCEILGMSANVPTDIVFSFTGLIRRGGETGPHRDGWGIAFYEDKGLRLFHDPEESSRSKIAAFLQSYPIRSEIVVSHIRKANRGKVALKNTHPFVRELWGRNWVFAHNGQLKGIKKVKFDSFEPVGTTDSEAAFCWLLGKLRRKFSTPPAQPALIKEIQKLFAELAERGVANILMSDSNLLFTHCSNRLVHITRRAPFGKAQLLDADVTVDFQKATTEKDVVTILATRPLTGNENWIHYKSGEYRVWRDGETVSTNLKA
ncbi:class II glutamine amidotransferase [Turneriella parva]|uniref:class II glutamine amidotransferase n=1 Tax=Turneriella parva TaxID=29510 RepID=UPI0005A50D8E|nr:class II glutamine amidotransferase [Turneriella parva]